MTENRAETKSRRPPCPRCGGELLPTPNPNKVQCRECGRVYRNCFEATK